MALSMGSIFWAMSVMLPVNAPTLVWMPETVDSKLVVEEICPSRRVEGICTRVALSAAAEVISVVRCSCAQMIRLEFGK